MKGFQKTEAATKSWKNLEAKQNKSNKKWSEQLRIIHLIWLSVNRRMSEAKFL